MEFSHDQDQRTIGTLLPNGYLQVSRPAGTYTISIQHVGVEGRDETDLEVTAGTTYYVAIGVRSIDTVGHQAVAQIMTAGFRSERLPSRSFLGGYVFYRIEPEAGAETIKALKGH